MKEIIKKYGLHFVWIVSAAALLGSLYFSEILKLPPCVLCWYQRVTLYPMVVILAVGIIRRDWLVWMYALPLVLVGWLVSIYHNLLYFKILPETVAPCLAGVSCTTKFLKVFGFLDIPLMSLIAFTAVLIVLAAYAWIERHEQRN